MRKRLLAIVAAMAMVMTMIPAVAFADAVTTMPSPDANGVITLTEDVTLTESFVVAADETLTIDLNGYNITGTPSESKAYAVINNKGNLTIKGEGKILCDHRLSGSTGYAVNTINNEGILTIKGGTIENKSTASDQIGYAIDNNSTNRNAIVVIEGGTITASGSNYYDGIRQFCNSTANENSVTVKGGSVSSIWLQNPSDKPSSNTKDVKGSIAINGGTVSNLYVEPSTNFDAAITAGNIGRVSANGTSEGRDLKGFITGGVFANEPDASFISTECEKKDNGDGTWTIIDPNAPADPTNPPADGEEGTTPTTPTTPANPADTTTPADSPKTGDSSNMAVPMALAGLAVAAMAAVVLTRRKQSQK